MQYISLVRFQVCVDRGKVYSHSPGPQFLHCILIFRLASQKIAIPVSMNKNEPFYFRGPGERKVNANRLYVQFSADIFSWSTLHMIQQC